MEGTCDGGIAGHRLVCGCSSGDDGIGGRLDSEGGANNTTKQETAESSGGPHCDILCFL